MVSVLARLSSGESEEDSEVAESPRDGEALRSEAEACRVLGVAGATLVHSSATGPFAACCRVRVAGWRGFGGAEGALDGVSVHAECAGDFARANLADRAPFAFVCIHSGTEVTLTLRRASSTASTSILGSVTLPAVPRPPFGFQHDEWGAAALAVAPQWLPLRAMDRAGPGEVPHWRRPASSLPVNCKHAGYAARGAVVGEVLVFLSYESLLPGCEDGGSYFGPDVVVLERARRSVWDMHPALGAPNHRIAAHDNVYVVGDDDGGNAPEVCAAFEYGLGAALLRAASRQTVVVGVRDPDRRLPEGQHWFGCGRECHCAVVRTDGGGRLRLPLPAHLVRPCRYAVRAVVKQDLSQTRGSLFLLRRGTPLVVFDMDGTLTTGDAQVVGQFAAEALAGLGHAVRYRARAGALTCARAWAARGYQVVYLCGGQGTSYGMRYDWLINAGFPPGPLHLTRTGLPTLPVYASVGAFKLAYLRRLQALGLPIHAAYGNTESDLRAYRKAGVPEHRTFYVVGGGAMAPFAPVRTPCVTLGTDFTRHNAHDLLPRGTPGTVVLAPQATIRIPYLTLEI